jgi:hypothetical protein
MPYFTRDAGSIGAANGTGCNGFSARIADNVDELFFYCLNCEDLVVSFTRLNKHVLIIKPAYIFCYNCPLIGDNLTDFFFLKLEFRNKKIRNKNTFYIHQTWRYQNSILSRILKLF